jgi:hypothetical protein
MRWKDNIKMDLRQLRSENGMWMDLAPDRVLMMSTAIRGVDHSDSATTVFVNS